MAVFEPNYSFVSSFDGTASSETLLSQQGMYAADYEFALAHSIPVTRQMLESIPQWYHQEAESQGGELNVDIRVHKMKAGQYPASPGWHVDAAMRETAFEDSADKEDVSHSLVGTISTHNQGVSNTVFCNTHIEIDATYEDAVANNCAVLQEKFPENVDVTRSQDGSWTLFDPYTVHNVERCRHDGVRLFVRVSIWKRPRGHVPGLTKTEQVYSQLSTEAQFARLLRP